MNMRFMNCEEAMKMKRISELQSLIHFHYTDNHVLSAHIPPLGRDIKKARACICGRQGENP
jgi:hypothetical protein